MADQGVGALREGFRDLGPDVLNDIAASLEFAADQLKCAGHALAAAYAALPRPSDPLAGHHVLREHRGGGHVAAL